MQILSSLSVPLPLGNDSKVIQWPHAPLTLGNMLVPGGRQIVHPADVGPGEVWWQVLGIDVRVWQRCSDALTICECCWEEKLYEVCSWWPTILTWSADTNPLILTASCITTRSTYTRTIMQIVSCIIAYNILSSMIYSAGAAIVMEIFNTVRHAQATHSWRPCMAFAVPERADCKRAETAVRSQLSPWLKRLRLDRKLVQCI